MHIKLLQLYGISQESPPNKYTACLKIFSQYFRVLMELLVSKKVFGKLERSYLGQISRLSYADF